MLNFRDYLSDIKSFFIDYYETKNFNKQGVADKKVRISSSNSRYNNFIKEQTPKRNGVFNNTLFKIDFTPDFDFIINKPNKFIKYKKENSFLLHIEPPTYIKLLGLSNESFIKNFKRIYTTDPYLIDKNDERIVASPPFVQWHLGSNSYTGSLNDNFIVDYDFLFNAKCPIKSQKLVAINSNIFTLDGHKKRAKFIEKLCKSKINFQLFGGSYWSKFHQYVDNAPNGKWPIYSKSKFTLIIENEVSPFYWSEKFADAILCFTIPLYYGCSNIDIYFPKGSFYVIDINSSNAINDIENIIESDFFEKNFENLLKARDLILNNLNLFSFINREIHNK